MLSRGLEGYVLHSELLGDLGALLGKVVPSNEMLGNLQRLTLKRGRQVLHSPFLTGHPFQVPQVRTPEPVLRPLRLRGGIKAGLRLFENVFLRSL